MKKLHLIIWLCAVVISLVSCIGIYEDGAELAKDSAPQIKEITVDDLQTKIDNGEDFLLIDVRQPNEYYTANIPGSVLLARGDLEFNIANEDFWFDQYLYPPDDTTSIVIYCKSGKRGILATVSPKPFDFSLMIL